ncbi:MAG: peptidoglycan editing factor PgeF [Bacillota bacterium]
MKNGVRWGLTLEQQSGMPYFSVPAFTCRNAPLVAFSTRLGGVSSPPYHSLNLALHTGDSPERVIANRRLLGEALGIPLDEWVGAEQVHGNRVALVTGEDKGKGSVDYLTAIGDTDALVTKTARVPLVAYFADCVPLILWDPVRGAIGLAHAGWKGTLHGIGPKTLEEMGRVFGTNPDHCLVAIGPSIGPCCYEIGDQVISLFKDKYNDRPGIILEYPQERRLLDLWKANTISLLAAGVQPDNITAAGLCTSCHRDMFFSYRSEGGVTGRQSAIVMLN